MTISFVGAATFANHSSSAGSDITVDVPPGVADGDVLIAQIRAHRFVTDPTLGGAWAVRHETELALGREYTLIRVAAGTEPASYTWVMSTADGRQAAAISAWRGVDNTTPINVDGITSDQDGATVVAPAVTTDVVGCEIVRLYGASAPGTLTPPATARYASTPSALSARHVVAGSSSSQTSPGDTGTATCTTSGSSGFGVGTTLALTPGAPVVRPTADAGPDQTVSAGATVQLAGQASGGAGSPFTYQWRQISGAQMVEFSPDATTADATFETAADVADAIVLGLVVTDSAGVDSVEDTVTITVAGPQNVAVPASDVTVAGWQTEPDTAGSVFGVIDEPGDDATYAYTVDPVGTVVLEVGLSELTPAVETDDVSVRYRARMQDATATQVTVILKEGASTVIATFGPTLIDTNNQAIQATHQLTADQINSIGDFSNLRLRFEVSAT